MDDDEEGPGGTRVLNPDGPQTRAVQAAYAATQIQGSYPQPPRGGPQHVHSTLATQPTETIDASRWNLQSGEAHPPAHAPHDPYAAPPPHDPYAAPPPHDPYAAPPPLGAAPTGRVAIPTDPGVRGGAWTPRLIAVVVLAAIVVAGGTFAIVLLLTRKPAGTESTASASVASAPPPPSSVRAVVAPPPTPPAPSASASAAPALSDDDAQARTALEKLVPGIVECAEKKIHALPGTSPAVPDTFGWLKSGPYPATEQNWNNPFFVCTSFRVLGPMPFVFQWQVDKAGVQGTAVVWLDPDKDGKPDRAYGFTATMEGKDKLVVGPIGPLDAARPLAIIPRAF